MYSAKVSAGLRIDRKSGEVVLEDLKLMVGGYSRQKLLEKSKMDYNSGRSTYSKEHPSGWPEGTWHETYDSLMANMLKWKRKRK